MVKVTEKRIAANRANAKKSTGAKTPDGKAASSGNAIRHGILSQRMILDGESREDFILLFDSLVSALLPVGAYELILVEKMASVVWRQARLANAERASIELSRRMDIYENRAAIANAVKGVSIGTLKPEGEDKIHVAWCHDVLAEYEAYEDDPDIDNLKPFIKGCPLIFAQLERDTKPHNSIAEYLNEEGITICRWIDDLIDWCHEELEKDRLHEIVLSVAELVKTRESAPMKNDLMHRYQIALDSELYRAAAELRKQQESRQKVIDA